MPNPSPSLNPRTKRPELHTSPNQQKENRNDRRAQLPARPGGSTGTSRARRRVSREGTPRRARVPPIDYRDGLSPCLTNSQETDITTVIQRRRQHPRRTAGRDCSEQVVAIRRNGWSRSSVCPRFALVSAGDLDGGRNRPKEKARLESGLLSALIMPPRLGPARTVLRICK